MVTTRSLDCVDISGTGIDSKGVINLEGLEENIYWDFFRCCAFGSVENSHNYPALVTIGQEICGRLRRSPLAAKTIGGLLRADMNERSWRRIQDSKIWQLDQGEHDIIPVLQLSYQYLPSHLKKCFSFCSLYPQDFMFTKSDLTKLWIMQGFIKLPQLEVHWEKPFIEAEDCFRDLVQRCFFQKAAGRWSDVYVIHDLMHDVCRSITRDECFCIEDADFEKDVSFNVRHLSFFRAEKSIHQMKLCKYEKLLSMKVDTWRSWQSRVIDKWCEKLINIRSLSFPKCNFKSLPKSIGKLTHLQYLDVSYSDIKELPDSFCSLYNLLYLNMEGCWSFMYFPEGFKNLVNLRVLCLSSEKLILLYHHMKYIARKIHCNDTIFNVHTHGKIENLKFMNNLSGFLIIKNLELVPSKQIAEEAHLNKKTLISCLVLSWADSKGHTLDQSIRDEHSDEEVLQGLCPHGNLKELKIWYYRGRNLSPSWLKEEFLPALTKVQIQNCKNDFTIAHLPRFITELSINSCKHLTDLQNILRPNYLPKIEIMCITDCVELALLSVESFKDFFFLKKLSIRHCPKLTCQNALTLPTSLKHLQLASCGDLDRAIPTCLENLTSLEKLEILECEHVESISVQSTRNLASLVVEDCENLRSLPLEVFGGFTSLEHLKISNCPKLTCVSAVFLPPSLKELTLGSCGKLEESIPWCLNNLTSLETLEIFGFRRLVCVPEEVTVNLRSLSSLHVRDCAELQSIDGLESLPSLPKLDISRCPKLGDTGGQNTHGRPSGSPSLSDDEGPTRRTRIN